MNRALILVAAVAVPALGGALFLTRAAAPEAEAAPELAAAHAPAVERGRYLVSVIGCEDCHSPKVMGPNGPEPDPARFLAGHPEGSELGPPPPIRGMDWPATGSWDLTAWSGPWGVSYTFNLTPDENTGIGIWTEEMFVKALRTGRHMGVSRPILPPMPWTFYRNLTDEDLKAIYAFLRTIPPIHNRVPEPLSPEEAELARAAVASSAEAPAAGG